MNHTEDGLIAIGSPNSTIRLLTERKYIRHSDGGHSWLAVPLKHLVILKIVDKITECSYLKNTIAYLEEDCDMTTFCEAWESFTGLKFDETYQRESYQDQSPVRHYRHYAVSPDYLALMS